MANAPTRRPPNASRSGRRPPKGPFVASDLRARLKKAAAQLKTDGHAEHAAAVEAVLAPGGWTMLVERDKPGTTKNLALTMPETLRTRLKEAAERLDVTLGATVNDGYRKLLSGDWTPPKPVRAKRGSVADVPKVNLNVQTDIKLRDQVEEMLPQIATELGVNRVSLAHVTVSWLCYDLDVEED